MTYVLFVQAIVNGVIAGAILALPAIGFNAIFAISRYPNFMIGAMATLGAYAGSVASVNFGWPLLPALLFAALVTAVVGMATDRVAVRPLSRGGPLAMAIGSMAIAIVVENVLRFGFGNDLRGFADSLERDIVVLGIRIGPQQLRNLGIVAAFLALLWGVLGFTRLGRSMRAVADNPNLARSKGIEPSRVANITVAAAMALSGVGGVLLAIDTSVDPLIGNRIIFSVFAAGVLGGIGSLPGAVLGAVTVGVAEELTVAFISPAYRIAVGFLVILLILVFRPSGLVGSGHR